jgi:MoaA/NifB/PqqE/SkfB family radical SAM enzyme
MSGIITWLFLYLSPSSITLIMLKTVYRLAANHFNSKFRPGRLIHPLFVVYYITNLCNLRCFYCQEFSADKNASFLPNELSTEQVKTVLRILRKKFDYIYITGGEPYVRTDFEELVRYMKEIGFKRISLNTNGLALDKKPGVLPYIRDFVISLDSLDSDTKDEIIGCKKGTARKIFENIRWLASEQKKHGYEISLNCVIAPHTVKDARAVLGFALENGIKFSGVPQNVDFTVHPDFKENHEYRDFITEVLSYKEKTGLISGTRYFLRHLLNPTQFECYPNVVARVAANGDLYWPCHPIHTVANNLLKLGSYDEAVKEGIRKYGILNACTKSCQMRCYIESSLLVKHPLALVKEFFGRRSLRPVSLPKPLPKESSISRVA